MSLFVSFFLHNSTALLACIFGDDQCIRVITEREEAIMFLKKSCNRCGPDIDQICVMECLHEFAGSIIQLKSSAILFHVNSLCGFRLFSICSPGL